MKRNNSEASTAIHVDVILISLMIVIKGRRYCAGIIDPRANFTLRCSLLSSLSLFPRAIAITKRTNEKLPLLETKIKASYSLKISNTNDAIPMIRSQPKRKLTITNRTRAEKLSHSEKPLTNLRKYTTDLLL